MCVCPCLLLVKVFSVHILNELARRPPKPPTGGHAVTAQLIVAYQSCTTKSPVLIFQLPSYSAYYSCTTKSPVLIFQLHRYSAYSTCTTHSPVLIFPLHSPATLRTKVVLPSRQFSSSSSPATPRTKVVLQSRQFSASSSTDCSAYSSCTRNSPVLSFQLHSYSAY